MHRRAFIVSVASGHVIMRSVAEAQPAKGVSRIAYLGQNSAEFGQHLLSAFRHGVREFGWIEGQNIVIESQFADGSLDRLPALVAELIRLNVDVIVTGSSATTWAAKGATTSIPIVMAASVNALGEGLVASLAHPGGNITGMTFLAGPEIASKQLQLLREMVPTFSSVAVLTNPTNRSHAAFSKDLKVTARALGAQLNVLEAPTPAGIDSAFVVMTRERVAALLVLTDSMFLAQQQRIADLAAKSRLPALYSQREFVDAGGLVSYGPSLSDMFHRAASHVDKILRGAKPADIPVEQPTKFDLVINLKTVKTLELTIPKSLLLRADEVIQ